MAFILMGSLLSFFFFFWLERIQASICSAVLSSGKEAITCDLTFVTAPCNLSWQSQVTFISIVPSATAKASCSQDSSLARTWVFQTQWPRTKAWSSALGNENILSAPWCEGPWHRVTDQICIRMVQSCLLSLFISLPVSPKIFLNSGTWSKCFQHAIKLQTRCKWLFHFLLGNMANY